MTTVPRVRLRAALVFGATLAAAVVPAAPGAAMVPAAACVGEEGVTVVVDFTDLGGGIEVGCAAGDPATGRDALAAAGFTPADGAYPGMICTIDAQPEPCPAEFTGSYWAYWSAEDGGAWAAYQVGADAADPAPGAVEGWRYNDGATPPGVTSAALAAAESAADSAVESAADSAAAAEAMAGSGVPPATLAGVAGVGALAAAAVLVARRRRSGDETG